MMARIFTRLRWSSILASVFLLAAARPVLGDAVATMDWDPGPHGWTNLPYGSGWADLDVATTGGNTGGWLRITFPVTFEPQMEEQEWSDTMHTPSDNLFAGTWTENMLVQFDFWYSNTAPEYIHVRWASSDTNNRVWRSTVFDSNDDSMSQTNWTTLVSPQFYESTDWGGGVVGTQTEFLQDLDSIDWIGIYIWRGAAAADIYGIDNFKLLVPEPAECVMLVAALLALLVSLRSERRKLAATGIT